MSQAEPSRMNMQEFARTGVALAKYFYGVAKDMNDRSARVARIMNRGEIALNIKVLLGGHLTVGLWVEAILVAANAHKITNNDELEEFKRSLNFAHAWADLRRGNKVDAKKWTKNVETSCSKDLLIEADPNTFLAEPSSKFEVRFREVNEVNLPATFLKFRDDTDLSAQATSSQVWSMFGRDSSRETKVLVNDPTHLLVNAIGLLQHENNEAPPSLWDEVIILHYLFKLMRSQDGRKRAWSRGPFGVQAWDESMSALEGHEEVRQKQDWMRKGLAFFANRRAKETDKVKRSKFNELHGAIDYFIPFFNNYRDATDSKRAVSTQDDICYPSYPGYPSVYPRYTFDRRSAFWVASRR